MSHHLCGNGYWAKGSRDDCQDCLMRAEAFQQPEQPAARVNRTVQEVVARMRSILGHLSHRDHGIVADGAEVIERLVALITLAKASQEPKVTITRVPEHNEDELQSADPVAHTEGA
jgi:hypothetical protein